MNQETFDLILDVLNAAAQDNEDDGDSQYGRKIDRAITNFAGEVKREEE